MNPFEKEYKNRFEEAKSTDGIDSGAIWDNISNALPEEDEGAVVKRSFFGRSRYLLLLLFLVFIGLGGFFFATNEKSPVAETNSEIIVAKPLMETMKAGGEVGVVEESASKIEKESDLETTIEANSDSKNLSFPREEIKEKTASNKVKSEEDSVRETMAVKAKIQRNENTFLKAKTENKIENGKTEKTTVVSNKIERLSQNRLEKQKGTDLSETKIQEQKGKLELTEQSTNSIKSTDIKISELKEDKIITKENLNGFLLPIVYGDFPFDGLRDISEVDREPILPVEKKGRNRKMKVGLFAGLMGWSNLYQNNNEVSTKGILQQATSTDLGQSLAISLQWSLTKKIHLSTGIEYLNARTEFNYIEEWDTLAVVPDYEPLGFIEARATRTVKHNNQQKILSVPLMIGISKDLAAFELGVELGLGFNYLIGQKGKSLNVTGQVEDYNSKINNIVPYRNFFLSYQVQPYLNCAVNERFALQLQPIFRYQQHGNSNFYGSSISSFSWGIRFGGIVGF